MQLFNTVSNIDMVVEKMPTSEIEKWMEETEGMRDSQLASALEKFVLERWKHCGTILARTTTAEQALKAIAGGSGGSHQQHHQQGGGKSASPNSRRKNKQPFKKTGGGGPPNQVPAGQAAQSAQPGGGQQGAVVAAGAATNKQQGAANNQNKSQNQQQKWQPASAAPATGCAGCWLQMQGAWMYKPGSPLPTRVPDIQVNDCQ
jgi:hypothetical protein